MKKISKNYFFAKHLNAVALLIVVVTLGILIYFLYNNFYLTISQAKEVTSLQQKVISENLQKNKFKEILKKINLKTGLTPIETSTPSNTLTMPQIASSTDLAPKETTTTQTSSPSQ